MGAWESRVDQLLYEGEQVLHQVGGEDVQVVATTHRVLTFTPETEGPNFRAVDRPNVEDVTKETVGEGGWLVTGSKWGIVGALLLVGGIVLDFEGLLGDVTLDQGASEVGLGGIMGLFSLLQSAFALLDAVLVLGGAIVTLGGLAAIGWYLNTRHETVTIEVAGDSDIELPAEGLSDADRAKLVSAIDIR